MMDVDSFPDFSNFFRLAQIAHRTPSMSGGKRRLQTSAAITFYFPVKEKSRLRVNSVFYYYRLIAECVE